MKNSDKINVVGPQLKLLRNWRGWTQHDLSVELRALGWKISRNGLAQMEITCKRITDCDLIYLAAALNVNVAAFFPPSATVQNVHTKIHSRRSMSLQRKPALTKSTPLPKRAK